MKLQELHSFKLSDAVGMHDKLNPKLWHGDKLDLKVRVQLLKIARDFIDYLGIDEIHLKDIRILGSNVAYSYTPHSDLDLHIFVDIDKLNPDKVYQELFASKKMLYNDDRKITIHGIPVECYVQDINTPAVSLGEFSVLKNKWIRHPVKRRITINHTEARLKYEKMDHLVKLALKSPRYRVVSRVLEKLVQYRKAGLQRSGEYSPENVAYKMIRQTGVIDKLYKRRDRLIGKSLSIESMYVGEEIGLLNKPTLTPEQIAKKHRVSLADIDRQLKMGIKVEREHTKSNKVAREIALDHLSEFPDYYTKLLGAKL